MLLTLYDQYGNEKAELQANDSSTQDKEVQADNVLSLGFTLYEHVAIDVNDYVTSAVSVTGPWRNTSLQRRAAWNGSTV